MREECVFRTTVLILQAAVLLAIVLCAIPAQAAPFAYVTNQGDNTVSVIDVATNTVTATIPVGVNPTGVSVTPNGNFVYVVNQNGYNPGSVSVIATATNTVMATVPVGVEPFWVAITPNGTFAYVTNIRSNSVSVIATATNTVVATVPVGQAPIGVAITPNGAFAYVTNAHSDTVSVIAIATNTVVADVAVGVYPWLLAITPDGAFAYVANNGDGSVSVIATATNTVEATIPVTPYLAMVGITSDGAFAYAPNSGSLNGTFVTSSTMVSVIATATNTVVATLSVGENPCGVAITPDDAFAYIANYNSNTVSVIAATTNTVVATVPVGSGPIGVAITPSPLPISAAPNPASGLSNTFALRYLDADGASHLKLVGAVFDSTVNAANSCFVEYSAGANLLYLLNDAGTGSTSLTPGSGTLSNSQCTITGSGTSVTKSGNYLTLNLDVTASPTFTGKHNIFMLAEDKNSVKSSWVNKGTWKPAANQAPAVVSVAPTPATGLSNTFSLTYSDPNGATDLNAVKVDFGSAVSTASSCYVSYYPATNLLYLENDAGTGTTQLTPGSGTVSNSQCTITGSGTSVTRSGDSLTLNLDVTASPTYTGTLNIFMFAQDNSAAKTAWVNKGTWAP